MTVSAVSPARPSSLARLSALLVFFLAIAVLFYFANRAAFHGYFSGDDLDRSAWSSRAGMDTFYRELVSPKLSENLFRPLGCLYYRFLYKAFQLRYWPYVVVLQAAHFVNVILLFVLLRRLQFPDFAACVGALFYSFHATVIKAYWEPQYFFEVLACMLCLISMLLYGRGRWLLALIPFWLAYKSKEIAAALPVALLAYEMLLRRGKWKRTIPYFAISLNFTLQALLNNRHVAPESGYILRFSPQVLWHTISFYASAIFYLPLAGLALFLLPVFVRDRRLYLGLMFMTAMFVPMLILPGRVESVYWYIPMAGLAIVAAALVLKTPRWATALFFLLWLPVNYLELREERRSELAVADQTRWYTTGLVEYARHVPQLKAVIYQGTPWWLGSWGVEAAIHHAFGFDVDAVWYMNPRAAQAMTEVPMAIVGYHPGSRQVKGILRTKDQLQSYVRFADEIPESQLGSGWHDNDGVHRSIGTGAELTLLRPSAATQFELAAAASPASLRGIPPARITVLEDGRPLGSETLTETVRTLRWKLPDAETGDKRLAIQIEPAAPRPATPDRWLPLDAIGYVTP